MITSAQSARAMAWAAGKVNPPWKMASRANNCRCGGVNNAHEWSNTAVMLLCRSGTLRSELVSKARL